MCGLEFFLSFQQLVPYVSAAVSAIYKVSVAFTAYRYMFFENQGSLSGKDT